MQRREVLRSLASLVLGGSAAVRAAQGNDVPRPRILFFTRSALFEHPVIRREGNALSFGEKAFSDLVRQAGCEAECTKDGRVFDQDLDRYAAIATYSCGSPEHLRQPGGKDNSPPMTEQGWKNLDRAVRAGKPLLGIHPGIWVMSEAFGADVIGHGSQQQARMLVTQPPFPGAEQLGSSFTMMEEWFSIVRCAPDLHVILVQDCKGMNLEKPADRRCYDRPPFPATWARMHGRGRVFYSSMGHREDVWTSRPFQQILLGGLAWLLGRVQADITPNLDRVAPQANQFPSRKG
jgi:type 1 glutamine amidotransferase